MSIQKWCATVSALRSCAGPPVGSILAIGSLCVTLCLCSACDLKIIDPDDIVYLDYGDCVQGQLNGSDDEDTYRFEMQAGETALITSPWSRLVFYWYGPDGQMIAFGTSGEPGEFRAEDSGVHTLRISPETGFDHSVEYWLHLDRASDPGPAGALALSYGDCENASVDSICSVAAFAFEAEAGDSVRITMTPLSVALIPEFFVFGPDGSRIAWAWGGDLPQGASISADSICPSSPGACSIFAAYAGEWGVGGCFGVGAGEFQVCVERQRGR